MELTKIYVVTMWSGGKASRKWKTTDAPELLPQGTGIRFTSLDTQLEVQVIGNLSIEEYEHGSEQLRMAVNLPHEFEDGDVRGDDEPDGEPTLRLL